MPVIWNVFHPYAAVWSNKQLLRLLSASLLYDWVRKDNTLHCGSEQGQPRKNDSLLKLCRSVVAVLASFTKWMLKKVSALDSQSVSTLYASLYVWNKRQKINSLAGGFYRGLYLLLYVCNITQAVSLKAWNEGLEHTMVCLYAATVGCVSAC